MSAYSEYARNAAAIMARSAEARANAQRQNGQIWGNAIAGVGQSVANAVGQIPELQKQAKEQAQQQQIASIFQKHPGDLDSAIEEVHAVDPVLGMKLRQQKDAADNTAFEFKNAQYENKLKGLTFLANLVGAAKDQDSYTQALYTAHAAGLDITQIPPEFKPEIVDGFNRQLMTAKERMELDRPKPPQGYTLTPGSKRFDETNQEVASVPFAPPAPAPFNLSPGQQRFDANGKPIASVPPTPDKPTSENEPLVPIIGQDGKPVLVRRSQAEGKTPANSREQGRPVTSGDAGRIADLDTSLNDLATLTTTLAGNKSTGAAAKAGAALPNAITEFTGWGTSAKEKQAVIDRVKQVIGKALEGGVLRKEDEYKYEKILPTIGDPQDIVTTKLNGLKTAIAQRRQVTLDALADAGYDVGRYNSRTPKTADPLGIR